MERYIREVLDQHDSSEKEEEGKIILSKEDITVKAIQIYQPNGRREVRLVYRVYTNERGFEGRSTRHQKSYSMTRFGVENAWNAAKLAFEFIQRTNTLPRDIKLPENALNFSRSRTQRTRRANVKDLSESFKTPIKRENSAESSDCIANRMLNLCYNLPNEHSPIVSRSSYGSTPPSLQASLDSTTFPSIMSTSSHDALFNSPSSPSVLAHNPNDNVGTNENTHTTNTHQQFMNFNSNTDILHLLYK